MDKKVEEQITKAFANKKYEWRTIRGIATEAKATQDDVRQYIKNHGSDIVKSSSRNEGGESLYTLRNLYRENASVGSRISSIFRNRGA